MLVPVLGLHWETQGLIDWHQQWRAHEYLGTSNGSLRIWNRQDAHPPRQSERRHISTYKKNILEGMAWLVGGARTNDCLYFHYAGMVLF